MVIGGCDFINIMLQQGLRQLESSGYCSVCLTKRDQGNHDACKVFCGIEPSDGRKSFSRNELTAYFNNNGKSIDIATIAFYTLFVPWELDNETLSSWFCNVEAILLLIEKNRIKPSMIKQILEKYSNRDLYTIKSIENDLQYGFSEGYYSWNPNAPLSPVDYFTYVTQDYSTCVKKDRMGLDANNRLKQIMRDITEHPFEEDRIYPREWFAMKNTKRKLYWDYAHKKILSIREINGRPIMSSAFDLCGTWNGWLVDAGIALLEPAELPELIPKGISSPNNILIRWPRVHAGRNIATAHGRQVVGNPDRKHSDGGAPKSNAQLLTPGEKPILDNICRIPDVEKVKFDINYKFDSNIDENKCYNLGVQYLNKYTYHTKPKTQIQGTAIGWLLSNKNALCTLILPTGVGKSIVSICAAAHAYEHAKNEMPDMVIVVCPLIALLEDQVQNARKDVKTLALREDNKKIRHLHHVIDHDFTEETLNSIKSGECVLLFLTAEQLQKETILQALSKRNISWLFIDEAHGVIEFEDYRPAYSRLWYPVHRLKKTSPEMGVVIQTATLPPKWEPKVWSKILRSNEYPSPLSFRSSKIRDNLTFNVNLTNSSDERNSSALSCAITNIKKGDSAIIYSLWKKHHFPEMWSSIKKMLPSYLCGCYSSGGAKINGPDRSNQTISRDEYVELFSKQNVKLTLATMAFGLGINRPDINSIIFNGVPSNLNVLYQQAGRAARGLDKGDIHIFSFEEEDFGHQNRMNSMNLFYATTTVRIFEELLYSPQTIKVNDGIYLVDLKADSTSNYTGDKFFTTNFSALKILTSAEIIDWVGTFSSHIRLPIKELQELLQMEPNLIKSKFDCEYLDDDIVKVNVRELFMNIGKIYGENRSISSCYQLMNNITVASMDGPSSWENDKNEFALIAWLWDGTKEELEQKLTEWRLTQKEEYDNETDYVKQFLYCDNNQQRLRVISDYYKFCGLECPGCKGCK